MKRLEEELLVDEDKVCVVHKLLIISRIHSFLALWSLKSWVNFGLSAGRHLGMSLHCFKRYGIQM